MKLNGLPGIQTETTQKMRLIISKERPNIPVRVKPSRRLMTGYIKVPKIPNEAEMPIVRPTMPSDTPCILAYPAKSQN